jgi:hypothetical protein
MSDFNLNNLIPVIQGCIEGRVSKEVCQATMGTALQNLSSNTEINIPMAKDLLKDLRFSNKYNSVDSWMAGNKDIPVSNNLKNVLNIYKGTVDANPENTSMAKVQNLNSKPSLTVNDLVNSVYGINMQLDGINSYQQIAADTLYRKAEKAGATKVMTGGYLQWLNTNKKSPRYLEKGLYTSDIEAQTADANKLTSNVLENIFKELKLQFKNKGIKLDDTTNTSINERLSNLKRDEKNLIDESTKIEKFIGLHYFEKSPIIKTLIENAKDGSKANMDIITETVDNPEHKKLLGESKYIGVDQVKELDSMVANHQRLLRKVIDKRQKFAQLAVVMAQALEEK